MYFEEVKKVIVATLRCDEAEITEKTMLVEDLGADSLDAVELNMALEDAFGVQLPEGTMAELKTVGDIAARIEKIKAA